VDSLDDSEAELNMAEMVNEGVFAGGDQSSDDDEEDFEDEFEEFEDEYAEMDDDESGENEHSEDSFEAKHGEPRFEVIEEKM